MTATAGSQANAEGMAAGNDGLSTSDKNDPGNSASGRQTDNDDTRNLTKEQKEANARVESDHKLSTSIRKWTARLLFFVVIAFVVMIWCALWKILQQSPTETALSSIRQDTVSLTAIPLGQHKSPASPTESSKVTLPEAVSMPDAVAIEKIHAAHLLFGFALSAALVITLSAIAALMKLTRDPPEDSKGPLLNSTVSELLEAIGKIFEMLKSR